MYCLLTDTPAICNNSDVVEELGQIDYLLTDKTGTLTQNNLNFACCSIGGEKYDYCVDSVKNQCYLNPAPGAEISQSEFLEALALCHTVQVVTRNGRVVYQGTSSDEEVLVTAVHALGLTYLGDDLDGRLILLHDNGTKTHFTRHLIFEFDSGWKIISS